MEWIDIKDKEPEINVEVIVNANYPGLRVGVLHFAELNEYRDWVDTATDEELTINVTHWQPAPETIDL